MALYIINEWLWADSSGSNGADAQRNALEVISRLAASDHQIVIIEGSPFDQKAWALCKSSNDMALRIARIYVTTPKTEPGSLRIIESRCGGCLA